jgi:hypothetical protein
MIFKLKLLESDSQISRNILEALLPQVSKYMVGSINSLKNILPQIISKAIIETPEYNSILSGKLKYELGIPDPENKLAGLIEIWSNNIAVKYNKPRISRSSIFSDFSINMIRVNFSDVLYSDYASVLDAYRGYSLPWLEWLLLYGNKTIVKNKRVSIGSNKFSRTKMAIMIDSMENWRVPSEFAGNQENNWITRAIDNASPEIEKILMETFNNV